MKHQHFVVICYDSPDDRRRAKLHTRLKDFGSPVQYSVFECLVDDRQLARLQAAVRRIIKPRLDNVRYYFLCAACQQRIESTQAGVEVAHEQDAYVV
jgi:CRISPR-associated protein Cas2